MRVWEKEAIATVYLLDLVSSYQTHRGFMFSENLFLKIVINPVLENEFVLF